MCDLQGAPCLDTCPFTGSSLGKDYQGECGERTVRGNVGMDCEGNYGVEKEGEEHGGG